MKELTQELLKSVLTYCEKTGQFTRISTGAIAGTITELGYVRIKVFDKLYYAHRLAFLYMVGRWPVEVDHINGIPLDNEFCNLRECTKSQNQWNSRIPKNNTSGFKGVTWDKSRQRWKAMIYFEKTPIYIGLFCDAREASSAYESKAMELFGEFYREPLHA